MERAFTFASKTASVTGYSFYDLRRSFQTIAERCRDIIAVKAIMGHAPRESDMSARYRQGVEDPRLQSAVAAVGRGVRNARPSRIAAASKVVAC